MARHNSDKENNDVAKNRKIGKRSKLVKNVPCPLCPAKCTTLKALGTHRYLHHNGTEAERKERADKKRKQAAATNKKTHVASFCNDKDKLDVFKGDINQTAPIDDQEEEFIRLAEKQRSVVQSYYQNVILIVPATVGEEQLDGFFGVENGPQCSAYVGTSAAPGGCNVHQTILSRSISGPAKMLLEKNDDGTNKYHAFLQDIEINTGISKETNQKAAFKWESFHTYSAAGQRKTKTETLKVVYLNEVIETEEGKKGGLSLPQIRRAYRLGRSGHCIIGPQQEFEGIQIRFPLRDHQGQLLFKPFTTDLADNLN